MQRLCLRGRTLFVQQRFELAGVYKRRSPREEFLHDALGQRNKELAASIPAAIKEHYEEILSVIERPSGSVVLLSFDRAARKRAAN